MSRAVATFSIFLNESEKERGFYFLHRIKNMGDDFYNYENGSEFAWYNVWGDAIENMGFHATVKEAKEQIIAMYSQDCWGLKHNWKGF